MWRKYRPKLGGSGPGSMGAGICRCGHYSHKYRERTTVSLQHERGDLSLSEVTIPSFWNLNSTLFGVYSIAIRGWRATRIIGRYAEVNFRESDIQSPTPSLAFRFLLMNVQKTLNNCGIGIFPAGIGDIGIGRPAVIPVPAPSLLPMAMPKSGDGVIVM
jgi:hypothetical protein